MKRVLRLYTNLSKEAKASLWFVICNVIQKGIWANPKKKTKINHLINGIMRNYFSLFTFPSKKFKTLINLSSLGIST